MLFMLRTLDKSEVIGTPNKRKTVNETLVVHYLDYQQSVSIGRGGCIRHDQSLSAKPAFFPN